MIFGGIVAYILLILYSGSVVYMAKKVILNPDKKVVFSSGLTFVVTTIGGLVSALVIAKLAITKPGESPAVTQLSDDSSERAKSFATLLTVFYLFGWLGTGLIALTVGVMVYPDSNSTLGDIGTTWLGLAVASGYAYFGLKAE